MDSGNSSELPRRTPFNFGEYIVIDILGEGAFGAVARCFHRKTLEVVAVKVLKDPRSSLENEVEMLEELKSLKPDKYNIVRFIEYFTDQYSKCIAFETLDRSLYHFITQRSPLYLKEIRPIAQQLLVAFDGLKTAGIIHADLKLDNIMLVNQNLRPYKVKLIDFGLAGYTDEMDVHNVCQPYSFRAPEATLGCKVTEAIDMWSLGCTLGECFIGLPLFSDDSAYDNLRSIIQQLGLPSRRVLQKGVLSQQYFVPTDFNQWRFKSPEEYRGSERTMAMAFDGPLENFNTLESVFQGSSTDKRDPEYRDRMAFADLIRRLLDLDPETRITPREALHHPFLTMEHLVGDHSEYSEGARGIMAVALKDSTKVSDLSPPTSSNLQVTQAEPELGNPASVAFGENESQKITIYPPPPPVIAETPNMDFMNDLDQFWDEPLLIEETSGSQTPRCLDKGFPDPQNNIRENIQPEQSAQCLVAMEFMDHDSFWDEPLCVEKVSATQSLDQGVLELEKSEHNMGMGDSDMIWDEPLYIEEKGDNLEYLEKEIADPQITPEKSNDCNLDVASKNPDLIWDEPLFIEDLSGTQILELLDEDILDPVIATDDSFQPDIWDEPFCIEGTSGTQILELLDEDFLDPVIDTDESFQLEIWDEPDVEEKRSGTQILERMEKGIPDVQINIQPDLNSVVVSIDETTDTQTPELLDRPPHITIEIPDDAAPEASDSAGTRSNNSSIWGRYKTAAFYGILAGQGVLSYLVSSSPIVAGAVVLPMFLWGCANSFINSRT